MDRAERVKQWIAVLTGQELQERLAEQMQKVDRQQLYNSLVEQSPNGYITQRMLETLGPNLAFSPALMERIPATGLRKVLEALRLLKPQYRYITPDLPERTIHIKRYSRVSLPEVKGE